MNIKEIPIEDIIVAEYNPRLDLKPGDAEYDKIKKSIMNFGFVEPLVWNEFNKVLVGGHQRLKILKELNFKVVTVSAVNIEDKKKEKALNVALNKIQGDWSIEQLVNVLSELEKYNPALLDMTGFSTPDLEALRIQINALPVNVYERPNADDIAKSCNPDEKYFYVEYYGDEATFAKLTDILQGQNALMTKHSIDNKFFAKLLEAHGNSL